jgi:hypothetical protein
LNRKWYIQASSKCLLEDIEWEIFSRNQPQTCIQHKHQWVKDESFFIAHFLFFS